MKTWQKIVLFLIAVVILSLAISFVLKPLIAYSFRKILHRTATIVAIVGAVVLRKLVQKKSVVSWGLRRHSLWLRELSLGVAVGFLSIFLLGSVAYILGASHFNDNFAFEKLITFLIGGLFAAAIVGLVEEIFFRGFILQSLAEDLPIIWAVVITSLFYSLVHFLKPAPEILSILPKFFGLSLVGVILAVLYLKTGSLFASIGLHAGWVYFMRLHKIFMQQESFTPKWAFGENIFVGGVFSWAFLLLLLLVIARVNLGLRVKGPWKKK